MTKSITIQNKYDGYATRKPFKVDGNIKIDIFQDGKKVATADTRTNKDFLYCGDNVYETLINLAASSKNKSVISQSDIESAYYNKGKLKKGHYNKDGEYKKPHIENVIFDKKDPTKMTVVYEGKPKTVMTVDIENKKEKQTRIAKAKKTAAKRVANYLNNMGITLPSWLPIK